MTARYLIIDDTYEVYSSDELTEDMMHDCNEGYICALIDTQDNKAFSVISDEWENISQMKACGTKNFNQD